MSVMTVEKTSSIRANTVPMTLSRATIAIPHAELTTCQTLDTFALGEAMKLAEQRITASREDGSATVLTQATAIYAEIR